MPLRSAHPHRWSAAVVRRRAVVFVWLSAFVACTATTSLPARAAEAGNATPQLKELLDHPHTMEFERRVVRAGLDRREGRTLLVSYFGAYVLEDSRKQRNIADLLAAFAARARPYPGQWPKDPLLDTVLASKLTHRTFSRRAGLACPRGHHVGADLWDGGQFWAGAWNGALEDSAFGGGNTLDMTAGGFLFVDLDWGAGRNWEALMLPIFDALSEAFAKGCSGEIVVHLYRGYRTATVFHRIELPQLRRLVEAKVVTRIVAKIYKKVAGLDGQPMWFEPGDKRKGARLAPVAIVDITEPNSEAILVQFEYDPRLAEQRQVSGNEDTDGLSSYR